MTLAFLLVGQGSKKIKNILKRSKAKLRTEKECLLAAKVRLMRNISGRKARMLQSKQSPNFCTKRIECKKKFYLKTSSSKAVENNVQISRIQLKNPRAYYGLRELKRFGAS